REDAPRRLDAVQLRHLHVHDREVGLRLAREVDGLLPVACLGDNVEAGALEHAPQVETDQCLVLSDQHLHAPAPIARRARSSSSWRAAAAFSASTTSTSRNGFTTYAKTPAPIALSTCAGCANAVSITIGIGRSA